MAANNNKSYLGYLNKLVGECNNAYYRSIWKNHIHADYSALNEKIESSDISLNFKIGYWVIKIFLKKLHQKLVKTINCA